MTDPAAQAYPAVQAPEHAADVRPAVAPKTPAGHRVHDPAPPLLYLPGVHTTAVADVLPAWHAYPGTHSPEQAADASPDCAP